MATKKCVCVCVCACFSQKHKSKKITDKTQRLSVCRKHVRPPADYGITERHFPDQKSALADLISVLDYRLCI